MNTTMWHMSKNEHRHSRQTLRVRTVPVERRLSRDRPHFSPCFTNLPDQLTGQPRPEFLEWHNTEVHLR